MPFPQPGSIAFVGYNGDGTDSLAFLTISSLPAGATIRFTDNTWNGTSFANTESVLTWTTAGAVPAGTIVQIININGGPLSASTGSITGTGPNFGVAAQDEVWYAITGTLASPGTFLAAIANDGFSLATGGVLTGTGLTQGVTALALTGNIDLGVYNPAAGTVFVSPEAALAAINNPANWITQNGVGDQSNDGIPPEGDFLNDPQSPLNGVTFTVICFCEGTRIATPAGPRAVETLVAGDLVLTQDGAARSVRWMGRQTVSTRFGGARVLPVRIRAGALGDGLPERDLLVSPDHALLLDGVLVQAGALVNGTTITREPRMPERFTYWHVELADHSLILAEGVPAETFVDAVSRAAFDNAAEHAALFPGAAPIAPLDLPRAQSPRQVPPALRARLAGAATAAA